MGRGFSRPARFKLDHNLAAADASNAGHASLAEWSGVFGFGKDWES